MNFVRLLKHTDGRMDKIGHNGDLLLNCSEISIFDSIGDSGKTTSIVSIRSTGSVNRVSEKVRLHERRMNSFENRITDLRSAWSALLPKGFWKARSSCISWSFRIRTCKRLDNDECRPSFEWKIEWLYLDLSTTVWIRWLNCSAASRNWSMAFCSDAIRDQVKFIHETSSVILLKLVDSGATDIVKFNRVTSAWWYRTGLNGRISASVRVKANKPITRATAWCA